MQGVGAARVREGAKQVSAVMDQAKDEGTEQREEKEEDEERAEEEEEERKCEDGEQTLI